MFALLSHRAVIRISGVEGRDFLQRLVSNDVTAVGPGRAVFAALLTPQGKFLHDMLIVDHEDNLLLDTEADRATDLLDRLNRARLRAKVTLSMAEGWRVGAHWGKPDTAADFHGLTVPDPRLPELGARCLIPPHAETLPHDSLEAWDQHRLAQGVPDGGRDLIVGTSTLLEGLFDRLNGISWTKGCYVGQELTARMRYRGLLKKHLFLVKNVSGERLPPFGTPVMDEVGTEIGEIRSSCGPLGLACLNSSTPDQATVIAANTSLTVAPPARSTL